MTISAKPKSVFQVIGTSPDRHDGADKVTGRAIYGIDAQMSGMLHGKVLRSPHAHARIVSIDTTKAEALDGVVAVITGRDMPDPGDVLIKQNEVGPIKAHYKTANMLAQAKVLYHGHAVAAVAATDPHIAEEATRLIDVKYELLKPVLDVRAAMTADAPLLHTDLFTASGGALAAAPSNVATHYVYGEGEIEDGFRKADVVVEREFTSATVHQGYIEPHNALAYWNNADGRLLVQCSNQGQFDVREELRHLLRWPASKITVVPLEIGGGFGGKTTTYLESLAALLSRKSGRPVKMTMNRSEVLLATGPGAGTYTRVKIGATRDGDITAMQAYLAYEAGAFPGSPVENACRTAFAAYQLKDFRVDGFDVVVNKPKTTAYRAPGSPQAAFAVESVVDEIAATLGLDPLDFRRRNASKEGDRRADGVPYARIGNIECLDAARASEHWRTPLEQVPGVRRGRGVASGYWMNGGERSSALVHLNADGTVNLLEGSVDVGGSRTAISMQLAETLGISAADVHPRIPDTDGIGLTFRTSGSRVTFATGWAVYEAGRDLLSEMKKALAGIWNVSSDDVSVERGVFQAGVKRVTFREAAQALDKAGAIVVGQASVRPTGVGPAFAVHIADVEVDAETGKVHIIRYTAVQDVGTAIYPPYVEGQIEGGAAQGIGWALNEGYVYDQQGHLLNKNFLDYRMPTALDVPVIDTIVVEVPNPGHPYGVRGVGEVTIVPPLAAIANALNDALGVRLRELPMSPARVQRAIRAKVERPAGSEPVFEGPAPERMTR